MSEAKLDLVSKPLKDRKTAVSDVCEAVGVSRAPLYRYLEPEGLPQTGMEQPTMQEPSA